MELKALNDSEINQIVFERNTFLDYVNLVFLIYFQRLRLGAHKILSRSQSDHWDKTAEELSHLLVNELLEVDGTK